MDGNREGYDKNWWCIVGAKEVDVSEEEKLRCTRVHKTFEESIDCVDCLKARQQDKIAEKDREIEYYKDRACCDPENKWGHLPICIRERIKQLEAELATINERIHDVLASVENGELSPLAGLLAIGVKQIPPDQEDIKWAKAELAKRGRE